MKLTFIKDFCPGTESKAAPHPMTIDGDIIDNVISCTIESVAGELPRMTLTVLVTEELSDQVARRLKGKGEYAR